MLDLVLGHIQANWNDTFNGLFELGGAAVYALNIRQLLRDKLVRGFHPAPTAFFMGWGLWNLFYYPSLDQWLSFVGGAALVLVNLAQLFLMLYYIRKERPCLLSRP